MRRELSIKKLVARLFDLPNAYRVLDIMDEAGCDIEQISENKWEVKPKWYVSKADAEDLQKIVLFKAQYKTRYPLWYKLVFNEFREGCRILGSWMR